MWTLKQLRREESKSGRVRIVIVFAEQIKIKKITSSDTVKFSTAHHPDHREDSC